MDRLADRHVELVAVEKFVVVCLRLFFFLKKGEIVISRIMSTNKIRKFNFFYVRRNI